MEDLNTPAPDLDPATPGAEGNNPAPELNTPDPSGGADPAVDPTEGTQDPEPKGDWPENWRELYANGDEKVLKQLGRYASPKAALDALFAAQQKIRSGELKTVLKPDASPEEIAAWRADNGIPESPDKYELNLPGGLIVGEADKPIVDNFLKQAHEANMHPDQVNKVLGWYMEQQEQAQAQLAERDEQTRRECEDDLRKEFGPEYRRNLAVANELLSGAPEGVKDALLSARAADGTPLGNDPNLIRWLVGLAREINPIGTVVPGSGGNAIQAVQNELAHLRSMMADHNSEYWKGPNAERNQARYRELLTAMQTQQSRGA